MFTEFFLLFKEKKGNTKEEWPKELRVNKPGKWLMLKNLAPLQGELAAPDIETRSYP